VSLCPVDFQGSKGATRLSACLTARRALNLDQPVDAHNSSSNRPFSFFDGVRYCFAYFFVRSLPVAINNS